MAQRGAPARKRRTAPGMRLNVEHAGQTKMVGKVFDVGGEIVFCHEEITPTQTLWKHDSPGGIDVVILAWLYDRDIRTVHHIKHTTGEVYIASTARVLANGIREHMDGRLRCFLPQREWEIRHAWYDVPWVTGDQTVPPDYRLQRPPPIVAEPPDARAESVAREYEERGKSPTPPAFREPPVPLDPSPQRRML